MAKLTRLLWAPTLVIVLHTVWVFWQRNPSWPFRRPASIERDFDPMAAYGSELKILNFYARGSEISAGEKALVCYGVVNATAVRLDPPVESVNPTLSRCFEVAPARTTRYTLTAEGAERTTVSESVEIIVK